MQDPSSLAVRATRSESSSPTAGPATARRPRPAPAGTPRPGCGDLSAPHSASPAPPGSVCGQWPLPSCRATLLTGSGPRTRACGTSAVTCVVTVGGSEAVPRPGPLLPACRGSGPAVTVRPGPRRNSGQSLAPFPSPPLGRWPADRRRGPPPALPGGRGGAHHSSSLGTLLRGGQRQ